MLRLERNRVDQGKRSSSSSKLIKLGIKSFSFDYKHSSFRLVSIHYTTPSADPPTDRDACPLHISSHTTTTQYVSEEEMAVEKATR